MRDTGHNEVDERHWGRDGEAADLAQFAAKLLTLRNWERSNLPHFRPQIALDILLYAIAASARAYPSPTKEVHLEIGYSQDRVRETIGALVSDHWLTRRSHTGDRRIFWLQPTDRAIRLIGQYEACVGRSIIPRK